MIYYFPVCIVKNKQNPLLDEYLCIPDLDNTQISLSTPDAIETLKNVDGNYETFANLYITDALYKADQEDEPFSTPKPLEFYKKDKPKLYVYSDFNKVKLKTINSGLILINNKATPDSPTAYFVQNHQWAKRRNKILSMPLTLTPTELSELKNIKTDNSEPATINFQNVIIINGLVSRSFRLAHLSNNEALETWLSVPVEFNSNRHLHLCENWLPKFSTLTICLEALTSIPLSAGSLKVAEKSIFHLSNNDVANGLSFTQAGFNALVILYITLIGPGADNLGLLGYILDRFFHQTFCLFFKERAANPAKSSRITSLDVTAFLIKTACMISILHYIISGAASDFVQNLAATENIEDADALLSDKVNTESTIASFSLNQFNDPILTLGVLILLFHRVDSWKHLKAKTYQQSEGKPLITEINENDEDYMHAKDVEEDAINRPASDKKEDGEKALLKPATSQVSTNAITNHSGDLHESLLPDNAPKSSTHEPYSPKLFGAPAASALKAAEKVVVDIEAGPKKTSTKMALLNSLR